MSTRTCSACEQRVPGLTVRINGEASPAAFRAVVIAGCFACCFRYLFEAHDGTVGRAAPCCVAHARAAATEHAQNIMEVIREQDNAAQRVQGSERARKLRGKALVTYTVIKVVQLERNHYIFLLNNCTSNIERRTQTQRRKRSRPTTNTRSQRGRIQSTPLAPRPWSSEEPSLVQLQLLLKLILIICRINLILPFCMRTRGSRRSICNPLQCCMHQTRPTP